MNWRETAALREPIFPCYSAHRHLFAGAVIDTMYHTINRAEPANRSKIIFIGPPIRSSDDGGDYGLYQQRGGACFRDWLWTKYESAFIQQTNASSYRSSDAVVAARPRLPFVPDRINIGLHFRWGDVKTSDPDQPDWRQTFNLAWARKHFNPSSITLLSVTGLMCGSFLRAIIAPFCLFNRPSLRYAFGLVRVATPTRV